MSKRKNSTPEPVVLEAEGVPVAQPLPADLGNERNRLQRVLYDAQTNGDTALFESARDQLLALPSDA